MLDINYHGFSAEESVSQKQELRSPFHHLHCFKNCSLLVNLETRIRNIAVQYANGMDHYDVFDMQKTVWLVHETKWTEIM